MKGIAKSTNPATGENRTLALVRFVGWFSGRQASDVRMKAVEYLFNNPVIEAQQS